MTRIPKPSSRFKAYHKVIEDIFYAAYGWLLRHNYLAGYYNVMWEITGPRKITIISVMPSGRYEIADVVIGRKYLHIYPLVDPEG